MEKEKNNIKTMRFFKGLTGDDIYVLTGREIMQPLLSRIERGVSIPTTKQKELISKALGESIEAVFPIQKKGIESDV